MARQLPFVFDLPLMQEAFGHRLAEHVGNLTISGIGYFNDTLHETNKYYHKIEEIKWEGVDVLPLLNNLSHTTGYSLLHIWEAVTSHVTKAFEDLEEDSAAEYITAFGDPSVQLSRDHHHHTTIGTL